MEAIGSRIEEFFVQTLQRVLCAKNEIQVAKWANLNSET